ncbi:MAG: type II secretion system protein GspG [Planctomycetota bacterium]
MPAARRNPGPFGRIGVVGGLVGFLFILTLVAIARPRLENRFVDADRGRALDDISVIARAIAAYRSDTGFDPCGLEGARVYGWLRGPGAEPRFDRRPDGDPGELGWFLEKPFMAGKGNWQGPYLEEVPRDPWGRPYVVVLGEPLGDDGAREGIVVSAGPDGRVDSDLVGMIPMGDDIATVLD